MKSIYWTFASTIFSCLVIACCISKLEISAEKLYDSRLYDNELYRGLILAIFVFMLASLVLGAIAFVLIIKSWKARKISGIVELLILIISALFQCFFNFFAPNLYRYRKAASNNLLYQMIDVGNAINQYSKQYNHMPDAFSWSDSLINEPNLEVDKQDFHIPQLAHIHCNFAFNQNLSNLSLDELEPNIVLLFEADGDLNLSGDYELIKKERFKDRYFLFKRQVNIYILFIDGSLVKYRLRDGAISKYDRDVKEFTPYVSKGKSPYSPLRWKP